MNKINERNNTGTSTHRKKTGVNSEQSKEQSIHYENFDLEKACRSNKLLKNLREIVQSHQSETAQNLGMSIIYLIEGEHEKMLSCLEIIAQENPNISLIPLRIAQIYISRGDYKKTIEHLENVLKSDEENLTALVWLSLCYYAVGNGEKAKSKFNSLKDYVFFLNAADSNWI